MTPTERLMAEREHIQKTYGFYITPVRMAHLMDAASKISNILVKADMNICYEECKIVLGIVSTMLSSLSGGIAHGEDSLEKSGL